MLLSKPQMILNHRGSFLPVTELFQRQKVNVYVNGRPSQSKLSRRDRCGEASHVVWHNTNRYRSWVWENQISVVLIWCGIYFHCKYRGVSWNQKRHFFFNSQFQVNVVSRKKICFRSAQGILFIAYVAVYSQRLTQIPLKNVCLHRQCAPKRFP